MCLFRWKDLCKHIRSAVIGLAHALCRDTWQARRCVVIVLVLRNSGCTTVYNKSEFTVTEAHTITLQLALSVEVPNPIEVWFKCPSLIWTTAKCSLVPWGSRGGGVVET